MPVFTAVQYRDLIAMIRTLADRIAADPSPPTLLVGIGRGGLVPAVYLSHATGLPMRSIDYSAQDASLAAGAIAPLVGLAQAGERLLFVDDINNSGRTILQLRALFDHEGVDASAVPFATLINNSRSAARVYHAARTIDRATCKDWFVFPWEAMAPHAAVQADAAEVPARIE
ncbi:phosphoribosyltransferase [Sphingomonas sp. MMS24-JH45]